MMLALICDPPAVPVKLIGAFVIVKPDVATQVLTVTVPGATPPLELTLTLLVAVPAGPEGNVRLLGDKATVGATPAVCASNAPISLPSDVLVMPCRSTGRAEPRWSEVAPELLPRSSAGLPTSKAWVLVVPPLFCNTPSSGFSGAAAVPA